MSVITIIATQYLLYDIIINMPFILSEQRRASLVDIIKPSRGVKYADDIAISVRRFSHFNIIRRAS